MNGTNITAYLILGVVCFLVMLYLSKRLYAKGEKEDKGANRGTRWWLLFFSDPLGIIGLIAFWPIAIAVWLLVLGVKLLPRSEEVEIEGETMPTMEMIDRLKKEHDKLTQKAGEDSG